MNGGAPRGSAGTVAVMCVAAFMVSLDNLVVSMALPALRQELAADVAALAWVVNAYALVFAVLILPAVAAADRFGRRRVFTAGVGLFTVGSILAAVAGSVGALLAGRFLQGAGAAAIQPLCFAAVAAAVAPHRRGPALGLLSAVSGAGVALGPPIGGLLVEHFSWHAIFWVNVPVGLVLAPLAYRLQRDLRTPGHLDLLSVMLAAAGLFGIVYGLTSVTDAGSVGAAGVAAVAGGTFLLILFVRRQFRVPDPILKPAAWRDPDFSRAAAASLLSSAGIFGSGFLLAQFLQFAQGYTPAEAGVRTLPWTVMPLLVAPAVGFLMDGRLGRALLLGGPVAVAIALSWLAILAAVDVPYGALVVPLVLCGAGVGVTLLSCSHALVSKAAVEHQAHASGVLTITRELGAVAGVAILAVVFSGAGGYDSPNDFTNGIRPAIAVAALLLVLAVACLAGLARPLYARRLTTSPEVR